MQENLQVFKVVSNEEFFAKVLKHIPKAKKNLKVELEALLQTITKTKKEEFRNANLLVHSLREVLSLKIVKIIEITLAFIEKLLLHELFDGQETLPNSKKLCIDELLQCVIECIGIQEETVQILVVRNLHSIFVSQKCSVFGNSKSIAIQSITLSALKNIVRRVFERMESSCSLSPEQFDSFYSRRCLTASPQGEYLFQEESSPNSLTQPQSQNKQTQQQQQQQQQQEQQQQQQQRPMILNRSSDRLTAESARAEYCFKSLNVMIDNVILYEEKQSKAREIVSSASQDEESSDGINNEEGTKAMHKDNEVDEENMNLKALQLLIPFNCVPPIGQEHQGAYTHTIPTSIPNERGEISGKFGWCFECRESADYFCKDHRIAVCSAKCKKAHMNRLEEISILESYSKKEQVRNPMLTDALNLFKTLCSLAQRDTSNQASLNANPQNLKSILVALEMVKSVMESAGPVFLAHFSSIVKDLVVHAVLINSHSADERVFTLALHILKHVILDFRDVLLLEIQALISSILMKILESSSSTLRSRELVLNVFQSLFKQPRVILEIFVNYDCRLNYPNLAQQIIELLSRISLGKYTKAEYASSIPQPSHELYFRQFALETLVLLTKQLVQFMMLSDEPSRNSQTTTSSVSGTLSIQQSNDSIGSAQNLDDENTINSESTSSITLERNNSQKVASSANQSVFDQIKLKQTIRKCINKFNYKHNEGIQMLFSEAIIQRPPTASTNSDTQSSVDSAQNINNQTSQSAYNISVQQMSEFLFTHSKQLRRTSLGNFFGESKQYSQDVFRSYLKHVPLSNISIDDGLREIFISIFPPGEAESLDRIIQHFSERYTEANPTAFKNAGVTYTLAFAIMMLQTNLYNPIIKENEKMTIESFIKLVKGINDGDDLDRTEVTEIYTRVKSNPLGIHDAHKNTNQNTNTKTSDAILKNKTLKEQQARMLQIGKQQKVGESESSAKNENDETSQSVTAALNGYVVVTNNSFTRDFLQAIWSSLYASFSSFFEINGNITMIAYCFNGLLFSVQLLGRCHLAFELLAVVNGVIKHTSLLQSSQSPPLVLQGSAAANTNGNSMSQQMQTNISNNLLSTTYLTEKNLLAINCLLEIAGSSGNWLGSAWKDILECLSAIDTAIGNASLNNQNSPFTQTNQQQAQFLIEANNARILTQLIEGSKLEKIFSKTGGFESDSIEEFVRHLCDVCRVETLVIIGQSAGVATTVAAAASSNKLGSTRSFCLERISEVAEFNMDRVRFEWNKIWMLLSPLFVEICTSSLLPDQSPYPLVVVDIIKQLSLKFFQKQELAHFTFQQLFLQPFLQIFQTTLRDDVREFVLSCAKVIASMHFNNLKSGWTVLIQLSRVAILTKQPLFTTITAQIFDDMFRKDRQLDSVMEYLSDVIYTLVELATSSEEIVNLRSMTYILRAFDAALLSSASSPVIHLQQTIEQLWIPVIQRLSRIFEDRRLSVSRKSVETIFKLLETHGNKFSEKLWLRMIREVLTKYFVAIGAYTSERANSDQYVVCFLKDSCQLAFDSLATDVLIANYKSLSIDFLQAILDLFASTISQFEDVISKMSASKVKDVINIIGKDLSSEAMKNVLQFLESMVISSLPFEVLDQSETNELLQLTFEEAITQEKLTNLSEILIPIQMPFSKILTKIVVHLTLIASIHDLFEESKHKFSNQQLNTLQKVISSSHEFSKKFNAQMIYRYSLLKNGFMSEMKFPNLLIQERDSEQILLAISFERYSRNTSDTQALNDFLNMGFKCAREFSKTGRFLSTNANLVSNAQNHIFEVEVNKSRKPQDLSLQKFRTYLTAQHSLEQQKRVLHLKSILTSSFFPQLRTIPLSRMNSRIEELAELLSDLTAFSFERNPHIGRCNNCLRCETCKSTQHQSFHVEVANLLKQVFKFMVNQLPPKVQEPMSSQAPTFIAQQQNEIENDAAIVVSSEVEQQQESIKIGDLNQKNENEQEINEQSVHILKEESIQVHMEQSNLDSNSVEEQVDSNNINIDQMKESVEPRTIQNLSDTKNDNSIMDDERSTQEQLNQISHEQIELLPTSDVNEQEILVTQQPIQIDSSNKEEGNTLEVKSEEQNNKHVEVKQQEQLDELEIATSGNAIITGELEIEVINPNQVIKPASDNIEQQFEQGDRIQESLEIEGINEQIEEVQVESEDKESSPLKEEISIVQENKQEEEMGINQDSNQTTSVAGEEKQSNEITGSVNEAETNQNQENQQPISLPTEQVVRQEINEHHASDLAPTSVAVETISSLQVEQIAIQDLDVPVSEQEESKNHSELIESFEINSLGNTNGIHIEPVNNGEGVKQTIVPENKCSQTAEQLITDDQNEVVNVVDSVSTASTAVEPVEQKVIEKIKQSEEEIDTETNSQLEETQVEKIDENNENELKQSEQTPSASNTVLDEQQQDQKSMLANNNSSKANKKKNKRR